MLQQAKAWLIGFEGKQNKPIQYVIFACSLLFGQKTEEVISTRFLIITDMVKQFYKCCARVANSFNLMLGGWKQKHPSEFKASLVYKN